MKDAKTEGRKDARTAWLLCFASLRLCVFASALGAQDTVRFTPTIGHPTFAVREPVLRIKPNTVLISKTMFGAY